MSADTCNSLLDAMSKKRARFAPITTTSFPPTVGPWSGVTLMSRGVLYLYDDVPDSTVSTAASHFGPLTFRMTVTKLSEPPTPSGARQVMAVCVHVTGSQKRESESGEAPV
jgi:hypothetical protein